MTIQFGIMTIVYIYLNRHFYGIKISIFTRESSYCFQRGLAIAILTVCLSVCLSVLPSVCLSVTRVDQSKTDHQIFPIGCCISVTVRDRAYY